MKLKAKVTFEWTYEPDPKYYLTDDPEKMIEVDKRTADTDLFLFLDGCLTRPVVEITVAEEELG